MLWTGRSACRDRLALKIREGVFMRLARIVSVALPAIMLVTTVMAPNVFSRERKTRKKPVSQPVDLGLFKPNAIAPVRFAVHDKGLQWLLMANWGELGNPDDRPAGPPTPFHP